MGRPARILLWTTGSIALLLVVGVLVVDMQLEASRLGPRVAKLLAESGVGGSVNRVEASVDGTFSAEGVDLSLADGTRFRAESVRGDIDTLTLLRGHVHLASLEAKGLDITLAPPAPAAAVRAPESAAKAGGDLGLGRFSTGPLALAGRLRLADGTELRFSVRSEGVDPSGDAEIRAGLAWPGRVAGAAATDPRAELAASATFARTLGAHGLAWRELAADIAKLRVRLATRDAGPLGAGGPQLDLDAAAGASGLEGKLVARDAKGLAALDAGFSLGESLSLKGKVNLAIADLGVLTPTDRTQLSRVRGEVAVGVAPSAWQVSGDLSAAWDDLSVFSHAIAAGTRCEWKARLTAQGGRDGWSVDSALVEGPGGVTVRINKPLRWRGGALPADSSGSPIEIAANDAPLSALAPFLAPAGIVPVGGTWSVGAEITVAEGEASLACPRAASVSGLEVERDGARLLSRLNVSLPLRADRGGIAIQGFRGGVDGRTLVSGDVSLRPGAAGDWQADLKVHVDLGDLAGQPGWEKIPFDRLRGITVDVATGLSAKAGAAPTLNATTASIRNASAELLTIRQRAPISLDGALPTGPLFDAKAADLPLESLSALVPGLGLTGTLARADLTLGARSDGSWYVRSEAGPIRFADTGVAWAGTAYLEHCDLSTEIDLSFGAANVLRFEKTDLRSRGRALASGSATVPLGRGWPTASLQGELGALAAQPFAKALGKVVAGAYQVTLAPKGAGGLACEVTVRDAGFGDRALRLNLAQVAATLEPDGAASVIDGSFRIGATGVSEGKFHLRTEPRGAGRNWDAKVDIAQLALDDLLGLAPPETDAATDGPPNLKPDRQAAWAGQSGALELTLGKAGLGDLAVRDLALSASVEGDTARLASLKGKLMGGALSGKGTLVFNATAAGGPYALAATLGVADLDIAQVAALVESMRGKAEGKATLRVAALSRAPNLGQVARHLAADLALDAGEGAVRMPNSAAAISKKVGTFADIGIGAAALTAALGKGRNAQVAEKIAVQGTALRELQRAVEDYRYSKVEVRAQRLADGSIKLMRADVQGAVVSVSAAGTLTAQPGVDPLDWPLSLAAQLRGSGKLGECFQYLGYAGETPVAGESPGPNFQVSGTINRVKSNLLETLLASTGRGAERRQPEENPPAGQGLDPNDLLDGLRGLRGR